MTFYRWQKKKLIKILYEDTILHKCFITYSVHTFISVIDGVISISMKINCTKSGDSMSCASKFNWWICNYRRISTLSLFNKVFEKLIHLRLSDNVTFDKQFGFRRKCNTTLAVFHLVVADLQKSFHNKTYCICLFLDIRKAFDTVNV